MTIITQQQWIQTEWNVFHDNSTLPKMNVYIFLDTKMVNASACVYMNACQDGSKDYNG